jgi:hypothetical protein
MRVLTSSQLFYGTPAAAAVENPLIDSCVTNRRKTTNFDPIGAWPGGFGNIDCCLPAKITNLRQKTNWDNARMLLLSRIDCCF